MRLVRPQNSLVVTRNLWIILLGNILLYIKEQKRLFLCLQTFIVKIRMPFFGCTSTIYSGTERRGNRLAAREPERERVCVQLSFA